jgi:hypothetical protein
MKSRAVAFKPAVALLGHGNNIGECLSVELGGETDTANWMADGF